jgi:hypothetical protein
VTVELFFSGALLLVVLLASYLRAMSPVPAVLVLFLHVGALVGGIEQPRSELGFHPGQVSHKTVSMSPVLAVIEVENRSKRDLRRLTLDCAYVHEGRLGRAESRPSGLRVPAGGTVRAELTFDPALPALDTVRDLSCRPRVIPEARAD